MIPYEMEYKDPRGLVWHPYGVEFDSPDGKFCFHIYAISAEHAELQLASIKENAKVYGKIEEIVPR